MYRILKNFAALGLTAVFIGSAAMASSLQINPLLQNLEGRWTGKVFGRDQKAPARTQDKLSIKPFLKNRFLSLELARKKPDPKDNYQGAGLLTYDSGSGKYLLYWFDSDGAHKTYEGENQGNALHFQCKTSGCEGRALTLALEGNKTLDVTLEAGGTAYQTMVYSK